MDKVKDNDKSLEVTSPVSTKAASINHDSPLNPLNHSPLNPLNDSPLNPLNDSPLNPLNDSPLNPAEVSHSYDGVANSDVDWLFRGKLKKNREKERGDRETGKDAKDAKDAKDGNDAKDSGKDSREVKERETAKDVLSPNGSLRPNLSIKTGHSQISHDNFLAVSPKTSYIPPIPSSNSIEKEKISKLEKFKFGRSRSLSNASNSSIHSQDRKSSISSIDSLPIPADEDLKPIKKSLFNSFSLKFTKPLSSSTSSSNSLLSSSPSSSNQKLNPNLIGSASINSSNKQDLSNIDKPPLGFGKPRNRNSVSSSSGSRRSSITTIKKDLNSLPIKKLNVNNNRSKSVCSGFENVNLSRVNFAIDKLHQDPQQQIPSRRPKKGNVIIPEDLIAPPPRLSQGISLQEGGKLQSNVNYSDRELSLAVETQRRSLMESEKHAYEAHLSGKRTANEVAQYMKKSSLSSSSGLGLGLGLSGSLNKPEEVDLNISANAIEIETKMHFHENHFNDSEYKEEISLEDLTLENIYTRCCHLREILPIPATLKQLKNKSKPLQVLKMLNPKPTLIDVLSFSDFISITPIITVIFDNVSMTSEMLRNFLAALNHNKCIEKLSLRNVAIDQTGWSYLCKFLSSNKTVKKLDISQQKIKEGTDERCIRSNMNWDLFIRAIVFRGGMEELVLNGCKLSDVTFARLLTEALPLSTMRLGIAAVNLSMYTANLVADWLPASKCIGLDLGFNDMSQGKLQPFINAFNHGNLSLSFLSFNSTNLSDVNEVSDLLHALTKAEQLKYLDLSSVPLLFPNIIGKLEKFLPLFPSLRRIHLDLNELKAPAIAAIGDIFPKMKNLIHVTLLGNRELTYGAVGSLYTAVKFSKISCLELDYDLVPDELSRRIAFYLMKNMDKTVSEVITQDDDLIFDGSLLMDSAEKLMNEIDKTSDQKDDIKVQRIIANALITRTKAVRQEIHHQIDTLFEKRKLGSLSLEGKELLLRYCLLDSSMDKVTAMFEEQAKIYGYLHESEPGTPTVDLLELKLEPPKISEPDTNAIYLHASSSELIASLSPHNSSRTNNLASVGYFAGIDQSFQPHQVVTENSDGKDVAIDNLTGRPVLFRSISHTSLHARELEEEEGELHKLAVFIRKQDMEDTTDKKDVPILSIPSGSQLREAIIAAKGLQSADDLIDKLNTNRVDITEIYGIGRRDENSNSMNNDNNDTGSPNQIPKTDQQDDNGVDVLYDNLLNEAQRARSISRPSPGL